MRVLFLDIDGVLNSAEFFRARPEPRGLTDVQWVDLQIDHAAVQRLNRILEQSGAVVVVSSTWRLMHSLNQIDAVLRRAGFTGRMRGVTPDEPRLRRGGEIQLWLDGHRGVESCVVLDDDADMAHLAHRLVRTTFEHGLTDAHVEQAVAMFAA